MEYLDVVNEHDEVIGRASREDVHNKHLIHRAVTVFLFNSKNQLLMIQRGKQKKLNPMKWQGSASGHVMSEEKYQEAAKRELEEELGIKAEPNFEFDIKVYSAEQKEHFRLFSCKSDSPIKTNEEIIQSKFVSVDEIRREIERTPYKFRDAFVELFKKYF